MESTHSDAPDMRPPSWSPAIDKSAISDGRGWQLGNYRLIRLLAEGGFAEVYLGEHIHLGTLAAIKVLHARLDSGDWGKFRKEARIVARLRHPHIVSIHDFDVENGIPFLVMNYAPHGNLRQRHPKGTRLSPPVILPYLEQVADALQYAHNEQLIHRDIKPENMLVGERDAILLSDFGIAIVISAHSQTTREVVGTISYMAPEQLNGKPGIWSDQYALGVVAYEWMCGECAFHGSLGVGAAQHMNSPPPSLCEQVPGLPSTIEEVVFKALAKDPLQRYPSILDFFYAFECAIQPQPLQLRAPVENKDNRDDAHNAYESRTIQVMPAPGTVQDERKRPHISRRTVVFGLAGLATIGLAGAGITWLARLFPQTHHSSASSVATPTPVPIGTLLLTYNGHSAAVLAVTWSPDINFIASGGQDHVVHVWRARSGNDTYTYGGHGDAVNAVEWSPDGSAIASGSSDTTVQVWQAAYGNTITTYNKHTDAVTAVAWSPDSSTIASASKDHTVRVWKAVDGSDIGTYTGHSDAVNTVAWSPNGTLIASGSNDKTVQIWQTSNGQLVTTYRGHTDAVNTLAWSADGIYIASGSSDKTVHVWQAADGSAGRA